MTTPHRGLPPPPAMSLPSSTQAATGLGPCPPQLQGSEEVYRTWLQAKMEEDRRRAEEERTRQEQYRVETRKADLEFLKESLRAGIPPPLVPIMFAGRGALKGAGRDWLNDFVAQNLGPAMQQHQQQQQQQYVQQQQQQQQQQQHHQQHQQQQQPQQQQQQQPQQHHHHHHQPQHTHQVPPVQHSPQAPPLRRATRVIGQQSGGPPHPVHMGPPSAGGMTSQQAAPGLPPPPPPPPPPPVGYLPPYQVPGGGHPPPPPMQPGPLSRLPKLDTNEQRPAQQPQPPMHLGMPPGQMGGPPHGPPMQPGPPPPQQPPPPQSEAAASQSSPAIYFYHWVPPHSSGVGNATPVQATASPQRQLDSPFTHQPQMNQVTGPEYSHSPKKRKASTQGPVVSQPFSPSFHATPLPPTSVSTPNRTRRGHSRHRSDTSGPVTRGFEPYSKASRHRRSIGEGPISEDNPPATPLVGDNGGGPHHPHDPHEQQRSRQQSVPPPSLQRPYSAGAEFRREHYPPPQPQPPPPPPESGGVVSGNGDDDGRTKSGNGNGRD